MKSGPDVVARTPSMKISARFLSLTMGLLAGCSPEPGGVLQGYIEGEYVYPAAPVAGTLTHLAVSRGEGVQAGQLLFELEAEAETAAAREADHRVAQARARLANLTKGLRPSEIASLEAQLERAKANLHLSEVELARLTKLSEASVISPEELDRAKAARDSSLAQVASLTADLETARLGARDDEIRAAEADVEASAAALTKVKWTLGQKRQTALVGGRVHDTLYRPGEFVPAGSPVVALLPPANIKVRFFVPEPHLGSVRVSQKVRVSLDGVPQPLTATVNYLATQAEFTPPVIYSQQTKSKLVYMIEAVFSPEAAATLHPGQPATVTLIP
jgi:HlyD family secretion protein